MSEDASVDVAVDAAPEIQSESPEVSDLAGAPEVSDAIAADPEAAQDIAEAVESGEMSEAEAIVAIRKLSYKVDGQDFEEDLPFDATPEMLEYLREHRQKSAVSQKRMQETAELRKAKATNDQELQNFLGQLGDKDQLDAILAHFGHDPLEYAEQVLNKETERMAKTPEQLELEDLRAKIKQSEEAKETAKEAKAAAEQKASSDRFAAKYEKELMEAMDSGDIPNSPFIIHKLTNMMSSAIEANIDVSFADLVPIVKAEYDGHLKQKMSKLNVDDLLASLSEAQINDLLLKKAPQVKKEVPPTASSIKESGTVNKPEGKSTRRDQSSDDFFNNIIRRG